MATRIETMPRQIAALQKEQKLLKAVVNELVNQLNRTMPVLIAKAGVDVPTAIPETTRPPIESSLIQIVRA